MKHRRLLASLIIGFVIIGITSTSFALAQAPGGYVKKFNIKAFRYGYDPDVLVVNQGDIVVVTIEAVDAVHGFYIEGYEVRQDGVTPKSPKTVSFIADRIGMFRIRCSSICGPLHPFMMAQLVVQPNARLIAASLGIVTLSASFIAYVWMKKEDEE